MSEREERPRGLIRRPLDAIASAVVPVVTDAVEPDALLERIDVNAVLERVDLDAVLDRIDLDRVIARIDLDAAIGRVDLDRLLERVDVDAVVDRVDVNRVAARIDVDRVADRVDVNRVADRVDVTRVLDRVDVNEVADRIDVDRIVGRGTKGVGERFLDLLRRQLVGLDEIVMRTVTRLRRRDPDAMPAGPPALVAAADDQQAVRTMSGRYAGPVSRLGALLLDLFLISSTFTLLVAGVQFLVGDVFGLHLDIPSGNGLLAFVALIAFGYVYYWLSLAVTGRTVAMALVGLKVVQAEGSPLRPGRAATRTVVLPFSFALAGLGALMMLVDGHRRALHDVAARSAVVYDWGDRPAALPAPLTRYLDERARTGVTDHADRSTASAGGADGRH